MPSVTLNVPDNASAAQRSLIEAASSALASRHDPEMHAVACAVETADGVVAQVNLDAYVGRMAVCADGVALTEALMGTDSPIVRFVAVFGHADDDGALDVSVVSPCGGCREAFALWCPDAEGLVLDQEDTLATIRGRDLLPKSRISNGHGYGSLLAPEELRTPARFDLDAALRASRAWVEKGEVGEVAFAVSSTGVTYVGVSLPTPVERGAVCGTMVAFGRLLQAEGDEALRDIVTVGRDGDLEAPCGLCLELLTDYAPDAIVRLGDDGQQTVPVRELLPYKYMR